MESAHPSPLSAHNGFFGSRPFSRANAALAEAGIEPVDWTPLMPWSTHPRVMAVRRRFAIVDVAIETLDGFRRHQTGRNAAVLAYWGFLSVFPLLLAATTILGFVLEGNEDLRDDIVDSALSQIPVVGATIEANAGALEGNTWALVIGLLTALWASMKAFLGVQAAFDDVWEVDIDNRANTAIKRLRALIGLVAIGLAQIATCSCRASPPPPRSRRSTSCSSSPARSSSTSPSWRPCSDT